MTSGSRVRDTEPETLWSAQPNSESLSTSALQDCSSRAASSQSESHWHCQWRQSSSSPSLSPTRSPGPEPTTVPNLYPSHPGGFWPIRALTVSSNHNTRPLQSTPSRCSDSGSLTPACQWQRPQMEARLPPQHRCSLSLAVPQRDVLPLSESLIRVASG